MKRYHDKAAAISLPADSNKGQTFVVSGEKTQGMGLRKLFHKLLDERGVNGLAVNNPHTNEVELSLSAPEPDSVLKELVARVKAEKNRDVEYRPSDHDTQMVPVEVRNRMLERLRQMHYKAYLESSLYDPNDSELIPRDKHRIDIADRYRLQDTGKALVGMVPERAARQLRGEEMPYSWMSQPSAPVAPLGKQSGILNYAMESPGHAAAVALPVALALNAALNPSVHKAMGWDTAKDVRQEITNGRPYPFSYLTGEAQELGDALLHGSWKDVKEEFGDTAYAGQQLFSQATGTNLPMVFSDEPIGKFRERNAKWNKVFAERGIPFSVDYLAGGSNYLKPEKVKAVFAMAGVPLPDAEAKDLSSRMAAMPDDAHKPASALETLGLPKQAIVKQDESSGKWILWTKDHKRRLGTHETAQDAYKQEYAIQEKREDP